MASPKKPRGEQELSITGPVDVADLLDRRAAERPEGSALSVDGETWTFRDLQSLSLKAASYLSAHGAGHGSTVALPIPNSAEQTALFFGAWRIGAVPLPLSPDMPAAELQAVMAAANADVVVSDPDAILNAPRWSAPNLPSPMLKALATGGSTGTPKIILDTRPSALDPDFDFMGWNLGDALFLPGPTYHSGPMSHLVEGLVRGRHVILMRKFDPARALDLITLHRPHFALFVPTMMHRIMRLPEEVRARADMTSLKRVWHTAAPCPPPLKQAWIDWIGGDAIWEIYGGSEGISTTMITGTEWLDHPGSVGRVVTGEMAVLDDDFRPVPAGETGEIFMRNAAVPSPMIYAGEVPRRLHEDWESFGDMGWFDDEGYLFLADRRRDIVISGGQNIYPAEVEAALLEFSEVGDAAVFGESDEDLGEMLCALVWAPRGLDEEALRGFLATRLVRYKIPRRVFLSDGPIRNDAGKIRRSALRAPQEPAA